MAKYIDAEKAFEEITDFAGSANTKGAYGAFWKAAKHVRAMPAADVAPVVHGRWECVDFCSPNLKCSACGGLAPMDCCGDYHSERTTFCPNCGAKMDEDNLPSGDE